MTNEERIWITLGGSDIKSFRDNKTSSAYSDVEVHLYPIIIGVLLWACWIFSVRGSSDGADNKGGHGPPLQGPLLFGKWDEKQFPVGSWAEGLLWSTFITFQKCFLNPIQVSLNQELQTLSVRDPDEKFALSLDPQKKKKQRSKTKKNKSVFLYFSQERYEWTVLYFQVCLSENE